MINNRNIKNIRTELISALINHPKLVGRHPLEPKWLMNGNCQSIYKAIVTLVSKSNNLDDPLDAFDISTELNRMGHPINEGVLYRLSNYYPDHVKASHDPQMIDWIADQSVSSDARFVHKDYLESQFSKCIAQYKKSSEADGNAWDEAEQYRQEIDDLCNDKKTDDPWKEAGADVLDSLKHKGTDSIQTVPFFDRLIGSDGLTPQSVTVVGACSGVGKTTMMQAVALSALMQDRNLYCDYFTLEMNPKELFQKAVAWYECQKKLKNGSSLKDAKGDNVNMDLLTKDPYVALQNIKAKVGPVLADNVFNNVQQDTKALQEIGDNGHFNPIETTDFDQIAYHIKRDSLKHPGHYFCIIDHIGLITVGGMHSKIDDNQVLRTQYVTRHLKQIAIQSNCPIIEVSELNRSVDRWNKPDTNSLISSSSVETDSNNILFLYRYKHAQDHDVRVIYCAKSRMGRVGQSCYMYFDGDHGCFVPFKKDDYRKLGIGDDDTHAQKDNPDPRFYGSDYRRGDRND